MGRAQVVQAEAAGKEADVRMNPVLLKPTTDVGSQVVVLASLSEICPQRDYFAYKKTLMPAVMEAYEGLAAENDVIVIEGAAVPSNSI